MKSLKSQPLVSAVFEDGVRVTSYSQVISYEGGTYATPSQQQQVAHTSTESMTGTEYYISASLPSTYNAAGYAESGMNFIRIDRVITFPMYGATRSVTKVNPIASAVEKIKGQADYGDGDMTMSYMPLDAGQIIVKAAEPSAASYSIKIVYPDNEIHYLDVIVTGFHYPSAKEAEAMLVTVPLGVNKPPVVVPA